MKTAHPPSCSLKDGEPDVSDGVQQVPLDTLHLLFPVSEANKALFLAYASLVKTLQLAVETTFFFFLHMERTPVAVALSNRMASCRPLRKSCPGEEGGKTLGT